MVPRALYLSDGRVIPTCVIQATQQDSPLDSARKLSFPNSLIGGGYLLASDVQGREHLGSVGALVSDGNQIYALTNRHVTGEEGREIYSVFGETKVRICVSDKKQIAKKRFAEAYEGWPGAHVLSNLDAGLVRVDDVSQWTTQVVGRGSGPSRGPDDGHDNARPDRVSRVRVRRRVRSAPRPDRRAFLSLQIGRRHGLRGRSPDRAQVRCRHRRPRAGRKIAPVFPGGGSPGTLPGDSGTLWCLEQPPAEETPGGASRRQKPRKPSLRPIALQWGGHVAVEEGATRTTAHSYALATCLSTVCRELDVDLVPDWNSGLPEYWGGIGHYTIAALACLQVSAPGLKTLMTKNLDVISDDEALIRPSSFKGLSKAAFVPLADVPDKVWKMFGAGRRGNPEHPNHFADMDNPDRTARRCSRLRRRRRRGRKDRPGQSQGGRLGRTTKTSRTRASAVPVPRRAALRGDGRGAGAGDARGRAPPACSPTTSATPASRSTSRTCSTEIRTTRSPKRTRPAERGRSPARRESTPPTRRRCSTVTSSSCSTGSTRSCRRARPASRRGSRAGTPPPWPSWISWIGPFGT